MRTHLNTIAISCLALAAATGSAFGAEAGASCDFSMQMQMPVKTRGAVAIPQRTMTVHGTAWQAGNKARINMTPDSKTGHVVIVTPAAVYTLDPVQKQAVRKPMTAELHEKMFGGFPLLFLSTMDPAKRWKNAKKIGTETLGGNVCDIWKVHLPTGPGQVASIWVPRSARPSYPVRAKMSVPTPQYANGKLSSDGPPLTCTVNASHFEHSRAISESQFAVPAGYTVRASVPPQNHPSGRIAAAPPSSLKQSR